MHPQIAIYIFGIFWIWSYYPHTSRVVVVLYAGSLMSKHDLSDYLLLAFPGCLHFTPFGFHFKIASLIFLFS